MMFLGVDPDLHATAFAIVDEASRVHHVSCVTVHRSITGQDAIVLMARYINMHKMPAAGQNDVRAIAVESQEVVYTAKQGANPRDLVKIAHVSGAALSTLLRGHLAVVAYLPTPNEWKGNVPKHIHQSRVARRIGWEQRCELRAGYICPTDGVEHDIPGSQDLRKSDWKHVMDAIGLALWARDQFCGKKEVA